MPRARAPSSARWARILMRSSGWAATTFLRRSACSSAAGNEAMNSRSASTVVAPAGRLSSSSLARSMNAGSSQRGCPPCSRSRKRSSAARCPRPRRSARVSFGRSLLGTPLPVPHAARGVSLPGVHSEANTAGALIPSAECGRRRLWSSCQSAITMRASARQENSSTSKSSSRTREWKD